MFEETCRVTLLYWMKAFRNIRVEKEACGAAFRPGAGVTLRMIEGVLKYELTRQDGSGFLEVGYLLPKK